MFCRWVDGALTRAVRNGDWILLDEINLASQPTLEGLNSLLDHRRCLFLPNSPQPLVAPDSFCLFATQNPPPSSVSRTSKRRECKFSRKRSPQKSDEDTGSDAEGPAACVRRSRGVSGRKGLPQSFLNRFFKVSVGGLGPRDLVSIALNIIKSSQPPKRTPLEDPAGSRRQLAIEMPSEDSEGFSGIPRPLHACTRTAVPPVISKRPYSGPGDNLGGFSGPLAHMDCQLHEPGDTLLESICACVVRAVAAVQRTSWTCAFQGKEEWEWNVRDVVKIMRLVSAGVSHALQRGRPDSVLSIS